MKTYTTVQGDMWDSIAHAQLGDVAHTDKLMNANLQYREFYTFPAGVVLVLPEIKNTVSSALPPWKKVGYE
nr:tail protein X [uncultured Oscillibacter sp.]